MITFSKNMWRSLGPVGRAVVIFELGMIAADYLNRKR